MTAAYCIPKMTRGSRLNSVRTLMMVEILRILHADKKTQRWDLIRSTMIVDAMERHPGVAPVLEGIKNDRTKKSYVLKRTITDILMAFPGSTISTRQTGKTVVKIDWGKINDMFPPECYQVMPKTAPRFQLQEFEPYRADSGRLVKIVMSYWDIVGTSLDKRWYYIVPKPGTNNRKYNDGLVLKTDVERDIEQVTLYKSV